MGVFTAAASAYETFKVVRGDFGPGIEAGPLVVGMVASLISGLVAIAVLLRFLRTRSTNIFVAYRIVVAAIVLIVWLS